MKVLIELLIYWVLKTLIYWLVLSLILSCVSTNVDNGSLFFIAGFIALLI